MRIDLNGGAFKDKKFVITNKKGATVGVVPIANGSVREVAVFNLDGMREAETQNGIASPITLTSVADGSVLVIEGLLI